MTPTQTAERAGKIGVLALVGSCVIWGLSSIYYKQLAHVPPIEVLAHRTLWSLVFFLIILALQGRLATLRAALSRRRQVMVIGFAAIMISGNWFGFIWAVGAGHATEASLGYYIFPLVAVLMGRMVFGESLARLQWGAIALAAGAVGILTWGLGVAPWISFFLSMTFGLYGLVKKSLNVGSVVSVAAEVLLLMPVALAVLWMAHSGRISGGGAFGGNLHDTVMLMLSGPLTGAPLMLFSYAAQRVRMSTVGVVQYINPTLQFLVATLLFAEPFTEWHAIAFPLIWAALALYSYANVVRDRAAKAALKAGASSTTST